MLQTMGHDGKATRLVRELGSVISTMSDQHSSDDFAAVDDDLWIFFRKQVEQPLIFGQHR